MKRRWSLAVIAWVVAAGLTTFVGIAAVESLGDGILGSPEKPLSRGNVESQLSASPPQPASTTSPSEAPSAEPSPTAPATSAAPTTAPSPTTRVLTGDGLTVVASCSGGLVTLVSWSPAQGYHVVLAERGPAKTATIQFSDDREHEDHTKRLTVFCRNGRPEAIAGEVDKSGHG